MKKIPSQINVAWIGTLSDDDLIGVEAGLHARFSVLETREKKLRGAKYDLVRCPADVMEAWDRWSRVNAATRSRSLHPRRSR